MNIHINSSADLRKIITATLILAVKDLQNNKHLNPSPSCGKEMLRTAYLMIFDFRYRMVWGEAKLSLEEMLDIACNRTGSDTTSLFRASIKKSLEIEHGDTEA